VQILDLSGCAHFIDMSALDHAHTLNLSGCDQLTGVSGWCVGPCTYFAFEWLGVIRSQM
jgi:hypothetical protein